jgi:hypothetical protein
MTKRILCGIVLAATWLMGAKQYTVGARGFHHSSAASCTNAAPVTATWDALSTSNTCGTSGGSVCSNGLYAYEAYDAVYPGYTQGSGLQPTYNTNIINTQPAWIFGGAQFFQLQSPAGTNNPIPSSITQYTFVAYGIDFSSFPTQAPIIGGVGNNLLWQIESNVQKLLSAGVAQIGAGTDTISTSTPYTLAFTYDTGAAQLTFYKCSGGSCVQDGSGSTTNTPPTSPIYFLGKDGYSTHYLNASVPEIDFYQGIYTSGNLSSVATYSQSCYGI